MIGLLGLLCLIPLRPFYGQIVSSTVKNDSGYLIDAMLISSKMFLIHANLSKFHCSGIVVFLSKNMCVCVCVCVFPSTVKASPD